MVTGMMKGSCTESTACAAGLGGGARVWRIEVDIAPGLDTAGMRVAAAAQVASNLWGCWIGTRRGLGLGSLPENQRCFKITRN